MAFDFSRSALELKVRNGLENVRNTPAPENAALGLYAMVALAAIIGGAGWYLGGFGLLARELPQFLTGNLAGLETDHRNAFGASFAVIVLMLVCSFAVSPVVTMLAGKGSGKHALGEELAKMTVGNNFANLLIVVFAEEVFARGLFLVVLTKIPALSGPTAFYALFLLGNAIWAAVHLFNFQKKEDRSVVRVVPQFISGALITYVFVKFGFLAGFVVHLGFDAMLFAVHKREKVGAPECVSIVYWVVVAAGAFWFLQKPLSDMSVWFAPVNGAFALEGWLFADYLAAGILVMGTLEAASSLLFLDPFAPTDTEKKTGFLGSLLLTAVGSIIAVGLLYGVYWLTGFLTHNLFVRPVIVALVFASLSRGRSGSSVCRSFWVEIPEMLVTLCIIEAVGVWPACSILLVRAAIAAPIRSYVQAAWKA